MNRAIALVALGCALTISGCASHVAPPIRPIAPAHDATAAAIGAAIAPSLYQTRW